MFPNIHNAYLPGRLVKALLPPLASILSIGSMSNKTNLDEKKKGKKRARAHEVDEIFNSEKGSLSLTSVDSEIILLTLKSKSSPHDINRPSS